MNILHKILHSLFTVAISFSLCYTCKGQEQKVMPCAEALNRYLSPVGISNLNDDAWSQNIPAKEFDGKTVIALGESTHGTKEFNQFRSEVIKRLILEDKVKIVTMETEYCYSIVLNDYLLSDQKDTLYKFIHMTGWAGIYKTQEIFDMLCWIKDYNLTRQIEDRVQVLGFDMQIPSVIAERLLKEFNSLQIKDAKLYNQLKDFYNLVKNNNRPKISTQQKSAYQQMAKSIHALASEDCPETSCKPQFLSQLLEQTIDLQGTFGTFKNYMDVYRSKRDQYMAENILSLYKQVNNTGGKLVVWAHNGHIAHAVLDGTKRMGMHLKDQLGDKYFAIGAAFDQGSVRIYDFNGLKRYVAFDYPPSAMPNAIEYVLTHCKYPMFYFNVAAVRKDKGLKNCLDDHQYTRVIGSTYQPNQKKDYYKVPVNQCYDGMIFFKSTNAAEDVTKNLSR